MMVLVTTRKGVTVFVEGETKGERKKEERMREGDGEGFWSEDKKNGQVKGGKGFGG